MPDDLRAQCEQLSTEANAAIQMADVARKQAMAELEPLFAALDPNNATMGPAAVTPQQAADAERLGLSDWVKVSAAAADLYAVPGAATRLQGARVADLEQAYLQAKQAYSLAGGKSAGHGVYAELKAAKKDALSRLKAARRELTQAETLADKLPGSRLASTDLEQSLEAAGKDISKLKILKAAPLIDVAATAYNVYDEATEAVTALTHEDHWGDNIHKYGVVAGIGHSFADSGNAFVKDNVETAKKIGHTVAHAAESAWHGVFG